MPGKTLIVVIDGCALDYITKDTTPNLFRLGEAGFFKTVKSAMPSVTNVNHASILSGSFPERHGVVGNYYYNPSTEEEGFVESAGHMKAETIFDVYDRQGKNTALLTVKGKVLEVFGAKAAIGISVQNPDAALLKRFSLDIPPSEASFAAYDWIFKACHQVISLEEPDLVYCTTNDYMMHNYAPGTREAETVMKAIDRRLERIYELDTSREIYITADHGMNAKNTLIDLQKKLYIAGYETFCLLPLKDRYLENHRFQEGGAVYVHVKNPGHISKVKDYLSGCDFVEGVYDKAAAAKEFHLPADIGDLFVLCGRETAFAELENDELRVKTRTHGSLHEREIPLIAVNARKVADEYQYSSDIVKFILETNGKDFGDL